MPARGDFSFIVDKADRVVYEDMYAAITKANAWASIKMDPDERTMRQIKANLADCVGPSSFALRQMQCIARQGWDEWVSAMTAHV